MNVYDPSNGYSPSVYGQPRMSSIDAQMKAIEAEIGAAIFSGAKGKAEEKALQNKLDHLAKRRNELAQKKAALPYSGAADRYDGAAQSWQRDRQPFDPSLQANPKVCMRKGRMPSALDMSPTQLKSLFEASRSGLRGFSTHVGAELKDAGSWGTNNVGLKDWTTPVSIAEGTPGSLLPPELIPNAWWLRYDPTNLFDLFIPVPGADTQRAQVTWLQHYANTNPASAVSELAQKPDLGPLVEAHTATYSVVAGMVSISRQMFDDFPDWASTVPHEINAACVDQINYQVLQGNGDAPNMLGLFNTPNTLTRVSPTITGASYTAIDVLVDAITDIRVNNAYAEADLIILNPEDFNAIKRIKDTLGRPILNNDSVNPIGNIDNIWSVPVAQTTKCPVGSAVVMDSKIAVLAFLRSGMEIIFNPYGDWAFQHNAVQYRGEARLTIGVAYPQAINLVSNINYEAGGPFS
jgi:HK97 family phage major capsid protein